LYLDITKIQIYLSGLLRITSAAITPGTHPKIHNIKTIKIEPQPFPITDKGGKTIARITLQKLISINFDDAETCST
jgi:hypothetical protein